MENKDNWIVKYRPGAGVYEPYNEEKQYFPVSYEIVDMLRERDALRADNARLYNEIGDTEALKVENARLTKQAAEDSIKLLVFNEVVEERDAAIAALEMLRTSITQAPGIPTQENNWMLGIIEEAMGDED